MITQAAVVTEPGAAFNFRDVQLDDPRPDEIIVKMVSTGICHTDISVRDTLPADMFPRVLGRTRSRSRNSATPSSGDRSNSS